MLTPLQHKKLSRYFHVYDVDDDGRIGATDFERIVENVRILHRVGPESPEYVSLRNGYMRRWAALAASADADHDGGVDLDEWLAYWDGVLQDEGRYEVEVANLTARLFKVFDTDEDGVIGPDEFCDLYGVFGMSAAMARRMFVDLDADGDGVISHEELVDIGHEFYRGDDPDAAANCLFGPF